MGVRDDASAYQKERRRRRYEAGLCIRCPAPARAGLLMCQRCADKDAEYKRRHRHRASAALRREKEASDA